jgi:membrane protein implicated in regulation of membrane protease activity
MGYITAVRAGAISLVIFTVLSFVIPSAEVRPDGIELVLTVSTFLFAIFSGFFISRLTSRYDIMRDATSSEDAHWTTLYELGGYFEDDIKEQLGELIDKYFIIAFDVFELSKENHHNVHILHNIYQLFEKVELKEDSRGHEVYDDVIQTLGLIEADRNHKSVLVHQVMTSGQWAIVLILAAIIIGSMFSFGIDELYFQLVTAVLSAVVVTVLSTMRDLQALRIGTEQGLQDSGENIFRMIGRAPYFNQNHIDSGLVVISDDTKTYRVGRHTPGSQEMNIEIVSL